MKIYTKKGDQGETGLIGGTRVAKYHIRIESYGTLDELNSWMGLINDNSKNQIYIDLIQSIQNQLFIIGSHLASDPDKKGMKLPEISENDIEILEISIDEMDKQLPELTNFVIPGGFAPNSIGHIARCVCRRAERLCVALNEESSINPLFLAYLNRLSDWLFVYSRFLSHENGSKETLWKI